MDPAKTAAMLKLLRGRPLASADHATLYQARAGTNDPALQAHLAPAEHHRFAKELVAERPWMAPAIAVAAPLYEGAKAVGAIKARSPASLEALGGAWAGTAEGLAQALRRARGKPEQE